MNVLNANENNPNLFLRYQATQDEQPVNTVVSVQVLKSQIENENV